MVEFMRKALERMLDLMRGDAEPVTAPRRIMSVKGLQRSLEKAQV
jgi:hypothetical protein